MPSGREYHTPKPYILPALDAAELARMRAPPAPDQSAFTGDEDDSGDERGPVNRADMPGAFEPSTAYY